MTTKSGIRPKPEEEELQQKRQELGDLERQLIERELQLVSLRRELAEFERLYVEKVGARYAELDEVEAQIAELSGAPCPWRCRSAECGARRAQAGRRIAGQCRRQHHEECERRSSPPSLKSLYREVAKRIHPDLAVDQNDRALRQRLMAEANRAYEIGDEARLRAILEEYESSPDAVFGDGAGAELVRVIRQIAQVRRRLTEIDAETKGVAESELSELKSRVDEGSRQGRDILGEMASAVNSRINECRSSFEIFRRAEVNDRSQR